MIAYLGRRSQEDRQRLYGELLDAVATHRVADLPDRFEARKKKRRKAPYNLLMTSRQQAKLDSLKGVSKN